MEVFSSHNSCSITRILVKMKSKMRPSYRNAHSRFHLSSNSQLILCIWYHKSLTPLERLKKELELPNGAGCRLANVGLNCLKESAAETWMHGIWRLLRKIVLELLRVFIRSRLPSQQTGFASAASKLNMVFWLPLRTELWSQVYLSIHCVL